MRVLQRTCSLQAGTWQVVCQSVRWKDCAPLPVSPRHVRPRPAAAGTLACAASSSGGSNGSAASSANGWLQDPLPSSIISNDTATSTSAASGTGLSSSNQYDAIMMLGGGLLPGGGLPEWVVRRLEGSLCLYQQQAQGMRLQEAASNAGGGTDGSSPGRSATDSGSSGATPASVGAFPTGAPPIVLLGAGTPHKPPVIDSAGYVVHESTAYASYLLGRGVPAGDLLKEAQSCDTVGNAYFSLLMHALPAGWRSIAIVTSDFHMPRTRATFDFVYELAGRQLHGDPAWFRLHYWPVSDEGIFPQDVLEARAEKEAAAVATWHRNTAGMATLADLHRWLYATHLCYAVGRQHEFGREQALDPKLAATY